MNGKWIEIFRAGKQTDSAGQTREWTEADLDKIVAKYNGQAAHEAPVVVGHPESNSPSFGWVESLKRDGKLLFAKMKDVMPAFEELVKAGTYKKRSIALYPDLTLRHIGFLGGMPPAVKGLADIAFKDGETASTYEFCDMDDMTVARLFRRLREFLIGQFGQEKADQVIPDYEVTGLQVSACTPDDETDNMGLAGPTYKEAEMDQKQFDALGKRVEGLEAGIKSITDNITAFGETMKGLTGTIASIQTKFAEGEDASARREFTAFCEGLPTRIIPAEIPTIVDQLMTLRKAGPVQFSEGGTTKERSAVEDYQLKLKNRAETIQFGEFATDDKAGERQIQGDAMAIAQKAQEFQDSEAKAGRTITIADAVTHVQKQGGAK